MVICALKESKLGSLAVKQLEGMDDEIGWFVDKRPYGYQIDGITLSSGNVPTRNKSKPGGFIVTPKELLHEYQSVLANPHEKDALMGDVTAMLMFTAVLYTSERSGPEKLLTEFIEGRNRLNSNQNEKRKNINMEMLYQDLRKFNFHPEFDLYYQGFTLNVKKQLYRFPSILLLDLMTLVDGSLLGPDSWDSVKLLKVKYKSSFVDKLSSLLALACFARLRCYLMQDGHSDSFVAEVLEQRAMPSGAGPAQTILGYQTVSIHTWEMARDEFFHLSQNLMILQRHFPTETRITGHEQLERLLGAEVATTVPHAVTALAHYYCCEWTQSVEHMDKEQREKLTKQHLVAFAFSHLQVGQHTEAQVLFKNVLQKGQFKDFEKVGLLLNLGKCFEDRGQLDQADEQYRYAQDICQNPVNKRDKKNAKSFLTQESYLLLTRGLHLSKINQREEATDLLFRALKIFIIDAGTGDKCKTLHILDGFHSLTETDRLQLICNPTRELAHCVFAIGEVFQAQAKSDLARLYHAKAHQLGIRFVHESKNDKVTTMILLKEMGENLKNPKYLEGALYILEKSLEKETKHKLSSDVILSILECASNATDPITTSKELEIDLEMEISRIISEDPDAEEPGTLDDEEASRVHKQLFESNRTDSWYRQATNVLQKVHPDDYDPRFVKLFKEVVKKADMDTADSEDIKVQLKAIYQNLKDKGLELDSSTLKMLGATEGSSAADTRDGKLQSTAETEKSTQTDAIMKKVTKEKIVGPDKIMESEEPQDINKTPERAEADGTTQTPQIETLEKIIGTLTISSDEQTTQTPCHDYHDVGIGTGDNEVAKTSEDKEDSVEEASSVKQAKLRNAKVSKGLAALGQSESVATPVPNSKKEVHRLITEKRNQLDLMKRNAQVAERELEHLLRNLTGD